MAIGTNKIFISFCFRFSPPSHNAPNPEDVPADEVARVLGEYGVETVVLNACNSGNQPVDPIVRSAAHILVSQGIFEVVAMSHSVMKSTAVDFITAFYKKLLLERSTVADAVQHGRNYLRDHAIKDGRFSLPVPVHDDFVPVFYQCDTAPGGLFEHHNNLPGPETTDASLRRGLDDKQPSSGVPLLGRENDLLSIETAMCENAILKVVGDHGVGKTCFANRLLRWWRETGFIDHAFAIDCSDLSTSLIDRFIHQVNGDAVHGARGSQKRVLVCVDNFNFRKADPGSNERLQWKSFRDCVTSLKTHCPRSTWLLLGRFSETASAANDVVPVAEYFLKGLKEDEAAQLLRNGFEGFGRKLPSTREFNEQMEEFTDLQDGNPLAIGLLGSFALFFRSFLALMQVLKFGAPLPIYQGLDSMLNRNNGMMSSRSAKSSMVYLDHASNTLHEFKRLIDALEQHSKLALQVAMSLSACQRVIPFDLQDWTTWLFQSGGMLSNQPEVEEATLGTVEAGTSSESPEHPAEPAMQCVTWVLEQLVDFGFISLASQIPGSSAPKYYNVHPLLPHLLRFEIVKRSNTARVKLNQLPSILWHLYELRLSSLMEATNGTQDPSGVPVEVREFVEAEHINISNSVEACIHEPEFGYKTMRVLGILLSQSVMELSSTWARAQTRLLGCVLDGLEHLHQLQPYRSALAGEETADALVQIMILVWWRGNTLLAAAEYAAAHENATRGLRMLEELMLSLSDRHNLIALSFSLQCQAAYAASSSGSTSTDALLQLLAEELPAGLEKSVAIILDWSRYMIQTRYLISEGDAAGGPDRVSFQYLAKLYAHAFRGPGFGGAEFPNHQSILSVLEDASLDEERWSTRLRPAIDSAFVEWGRSGRNLFIAASTYLWEANTLKTDKGKHRESLQNAVEVARQTHDWKAEASSLDKLFALAAGEDVRAAIRIHEELVNLEQTLKAAGLDWPRMGADERNCRIGTLLITPEDSGPVGGHLYSEARPYFQRGLQGGYEAVKGTVKVNMRDLHVLYRGHMGLSRCGRSAGNHAEYVSNTLGAIRVDVLLSEHGPSIEWGDGAGIRWVLEELHQSVRTSTVLDFINQVAAVVIWDAAEILHFLNQCQIHAKTLLKGNSRAALEETQRLFFGLRQVDATRLKYWRHGQQGEWTLEVPKLRKWYTATSYLWIALVVALWAFWAWK